jgi:hypothetical protein
MLLRGSDDPAFADELLDIAVDERERISAARGAPLACAVLDASGADFPLADFARQNRIEYFDRSSPGWRPSFKAWAEGLHVGAV